MYKKWSRWLDRILNEQLRDLLINRHIFKQFQGCTATYVGTYQGAELSEWMVQNYIAFATMAIRRMIERPKNSWKSISLGILLEDLAGTGSNRSGSPNYDWQAFWEQLSVGLSDWLLGGGGPTCLCCSACSLSLRKVLT